MSSSLFTRLETTMKLEQVKINLFSYTNSWLYSTAKLRILFYFSKKYITICASLIRILTQKQAPTREPVSF